MKSVYILLMLFGLFSLLSCSSESDEPEPERSGFFTHPDPISSVTVGGEAGLPGDLSVGIPDRLAKLTSITLFTQSKKFRADLNGSGQDKFIIIPKEGEAPYFRLENNQTGRATVSGVQGFAFIKKTDTTFIQVTDETRLMLFATQKDNDDAMSPAIIEVKNGKIVPSSGGITASIKE